MMKCPTCGRDMVKGAVISSSSMPFSTNVMFKPDRNDGSCTLALENKAEAYVCQSDGSCTLALENKAEAYVCQSCGHVFADYKIR